MISITPLYRLANHALNRVTYIRSRIYISEVGYIYRMLDLHIGGRISYRTSDIHIGGRIYISEVGYTYQTSDIHIGDRIYISEVGYTYRKSDIHIGSRIYI